MRRLVPVIAALVVLPAVAAQAAPVARCKNVAVDPRGDTHDSYTGTGLRNEPGADITAINFRSDAKTLTVVTTLVDVDAPVTTAPMGRDTWVVFDLMEASFAVKLAEGVDRSWALLAVGRIDEGAEHGGNSASAWSGEIVADLTFRIDKSRNQIRVDVPLAELRKHTGGVRKGAYLQLRDAWTGAMAGISGAHAGSSIDVTYTNPGWTLGAPSCA